ncbi:MAG: TrkH family potassium uptake protein [Pirellulales bacterium]
MNRHLVARLLGMVAWLIGLTMVFSLPWAWPALGGHQQFELRGFIALVASGLVCAVVGWGLRHYGRQAKSQLFRKEAMAVVGLSWIMATVLGGLPYLLAGVSRGLDAGQPIRMNVADCLFESQSGFSTTGATVLTDIEDSSLVPRCMLFWRSSTHFLGGLGIIVLFVVVLGQGSAGKALMRAEMPGPSKDGSQERMQHTAWIFAAIYCGLNLVLTILLWFEGMNWFEALCHAFGTMATGGFSTRNGSLGGFHSPAIEYTVILFMILAGTNFTLLYFVLLKNPRRLLRDYEWRTFMCIILGATVLVMIAGLWGRDDFDPQGKLEGLQLWEVAMRDGLFQVVSILTTTGYGSADFNQWSSFSRVLLVQLMFIGGCAGSTGGGMKVIRVILFAKILRHDVEQSFHPSVVRHIRLGKEPLTDPDLPRSILVYVGLIASILAFSWILLVALEPDATWVRAGQPLDNKLVDSATAVIATLQNIGPGLGIVGATENYAEFNQGSKLLFTFLMMLGRIELFAILVLLIPAFWRYR